MSRTARAARSLSASANQHGRRHRRRNGQYWVDKAGPWDLESLILEKKLRHGDHPVLRMCCSNCVVERDSAGNRKLNKKRSTGKIDGMTALCNALAVAPLRTAMKFDVKALIA